MWANFSGKWSRWGFLMMWLLFLLHAFRPSSDWHIRKSPFSWATDPNSMENAALIALIFIRRFIDRLPILSLHFRQVHIFHPSCFLEITTFPRAHLLGRVTSAKSHWNPARSGCMLRRHVLLVSETNPRSVLDVADASFIIVKRKMNHYCGVSVLQITNWLWLLSEQNARTTIEHFCGCYQQRSCQSNQKGAVVVLLACWVTKGALSTASWMHCNEFSISVSFHVWSIIYYLI